MNEMHLYCVIEDLHFECQTLIAACFSLDSAKRAAAHHHAVNVLVQYEGEQQPALPEWRESERGSTSNAYYQRTSKQPGRVWVSKGDCRDYEIREMEVEP